MDFQNSTLLRQQPPTMIDPTEPEPSQSVASSLKGWGSKLHVAYSRTPTPSPEQMTPRTCLPLNASTNLRSVLFRLIPSPDGPRNPDNGSPLSPLPDAANALHALISLQQLSQRSRLQDRWRRYDGCMERYICASSSAKAASITA